jgi:hypothetical protein
MSETAAGPAHVATVSFLASRVTPTGGFWIALAGGTALARVAERRGLRVGFGASVAAMLETVAILGPARFGVPLTQAVSAPVLGRLESRSVRFLPQFLACAAIRLVHNTLTTAFFIWVVTGGLDAYAGTYDSLARRVGIEGLGDGGALALTAAGLLAWAAFASAVQVGFYRRGLRRWPAVTTGASREEAEPTHAAGAMPPRFDPRAIALAAAVAFALLLASTAWVLLAAVSVWLALAWALARPEREGVGTGLALAAVLSGGALVFGLGGGLGLGVAARRALRAALLVLVATWLRAAARAEGLREVSRRSLGRLRRLPAAPEAVQVLDRIGSERRLAAAGRALLDSLGGVAKRPTPVVDAVLGWVARESAAFRPARPRPPSSLRARAPDAALLAAAALPALALAL